MERTQLEITSPAARVREMPQRKEISLRFQGVVSSTEFMYYNKLVFDLIREGPYRTLVIDERNITELPKIGRSWMVRSLLRDRGFRKSIAKLEKIILIKPIAQGDKKSWVDRMVERITQTPIVITNDLVEIQEEIRP